MAGPKALPTTRLSTKGQVILPQAVRASRNWLPGTRLTVEDTPDGVLLKAERTFPVTKPEDVFGSLRYSGPPISIEQMDAAVLAEAARRHVRD